MLNWLSFICDDRRRLGRQFDSLVLIAAIFAVPILAFVPAYVRFTAHRPFDGPIEMRCYAVCGLASLISWTAIAFCRRTNRWSAGASLVTGIAGLVVIAVAITAYLYEALIAWIGAIGIPLSLLMLERRGRSPGARAVYYSALVLGAIFSVAAMHAATKLFWYEQFGLTQKRFAIMAVVLIAGLGLISQSYSRWRLWFLRPEKAGRGYSIVAKVVAVVLALNATGAALYTHGFDAPALAHHWAVFADPAIMMRQGHWLLWDVPSQYGFLLTAATASLPFHSVWYSLYILSGAGIVATCLTLYFILLLPGRGTWHPVVAALIAFAAIFVFPGCSLATDELSRHDGPMFYPSVCGVRFIWCYLLIALLASEYAGGDLKASRRRTLALGTLIWLIAIFWSFESAFFATAMWGPAFLLLVAQDAVRSGEKLTTTKLLAPCLYPLAALVIAVSGLVAFYCVLSGHPPDLHMYALYVIQSRDFFWMAPDPKGPAYLLLIPFAAPATLAVWLASQYGVRHRAIALLTAASCMIFAVSSYYVGRSHSNNVCNLVPQMVMALACCWLVLVRERFPKSLKAVLVPTIYPVVMISLMQFLAAPSLYGYGADITIPASPSKFHIGSPKSDALTALAKAGYRSGQPIVVMLSSPLPVPAGARGIDVSTAPHLVPFGPLGEVRPLNVDCLEPITRRFFATAPKSGWMVLDQKDDFAPGPVLDLLHKKFVFDGPIASCGNCVVYRLRRN